MDYSLAFQYAKATLRLRSLYRRAAVCYTEESAKPYEEEIAYVEADLAAMKLTKEEYEEAQQLIKQVTEIVGPFSGAPFSAD